MGQHVSVGREVESTTTSSPGDTASAASCDGWALTRTTGRRMCARTARRPSP
ncbi:hypothetical protein ACFQ60_01425 [Streptomyces zhihengii]